MLAEYKEVFLEELDDQLQLMDDVIMQLEKEGETERVIQSLFRAAHTLKGSSAAMGYEDMKLLTHEMEHLLDQVRSNKLGVTGPLIDLLFQSLDCLKELKKDIVRNDSNCTDITEFVKELQAFGSSQKEYQPSTTMHSSLSEKDGDVATRIQEAMDQGLKVYWLAVHISVDCVIRGARLYVIQSNLSTWGEVIHCEQDMDEVEEGGDLPLAFSFLYSGVQEAHEIQELVASLTEVVSVKAEPVKSDMGGEPLVCVDESIDNDSVIEEIAVRNDASNSSHSRQAKTQTIRVSVERLDHLMNLVGELVIDNTRIHQVERTQRRKLTDESVNELGQISDHLSRIIGDLQQSVMKTRMLPIEQLFNRFPRMIRDLTRDLGKDIELIIEGKDTELDRTLIEEIADPLIHLIRNAIDHGIEKPEKRLQTSKAGKGTLLIKAAHEDNQVVIYVRDDGAGIDPSRMKSSALSKGIITQGEAELLSEREAIELIFRPGFSTASVVSDVSGRGVGMDIVRSHIEKLNGIIDIETVLGHGTSFKIKLPLTLAIIVGLLVKLHEQTFIIPMSNIAEIVRVAHDDMQTLRGQSVILLREQVIPVLWLHDHFNLPMREQKRHVQLVIVGSAEKRIALAVDELIGNQEIVIKSMGSYMGKVESIAGSTILGDGKVALILDVSGIITHAVRRTNG